MLNKSSDFGKWATYWYHTAMYRSMYILVAELDIAQLFVQQWLCCCTFNAGRALEVNHQRRCATNYANGIITAAFVGIVLLLHEYAEGFFFQFFYSIGRTNSWRFSIFYKIPKQDRTPSSWPRLRTTIGDARNIQTFGRLSQFASVGEGNGVCELNLRY